MEDVYRCFPKVIDKSYDRVENLVEEIAMAINSGKVMFLIGDITTYNEKDQDKIEALLLKMIPNLVITHFDTDTDYDMFNNLMKVRKIYDKGMEPYFIDFSRKECKQLKRELR